VSYRPGDVDVTRLQLAGRSAVDLVHSAAELSVYEDVLRPVVVAEVVLRDDKSLSALLPLVGEETLQVEFATPNGATPVSYQLRVISLTAASASTSLRDQGYRLTAVSPELVVDRSVRVQKSYNGQLDAVVLDLLRTYLRTETGLYVERTRGVVPHIVQNERPLAAIDRVRRRANSSAYASSSYLFFQNRVGFYFCTVEDLCARGRAAIGDKYFTHDQNAQTSIENLTYRGVIGFRQPRRFRTDTRIGAGFYGSRVRPFDYADLSYSPLAVSVDQGQFQLPGTSQGRLDTQEHRDAYRGTTGRDLDVALDSNRPPTFAADGAAERVSLAAAMDENQVGMHVLGDSELKAGDVVHLSAVDKVATTGDRGQDQTLSGEYLVSRIRHIVRPTSTWPRYTCSLECTKGGYAGSP
jgi:hypothetical protein